MKKLILIAASLASMFLAGSCQRENLEPAPTGKSVTFNVEAPAAMQTKAIADGLNVNELIYEVYLTENKDERDLTNAVKLYQGKTTMSVVEDRYGKINTAKVEVELLQDQHYTVLFWAQVKTEEGKVPPYNTTNLTEVKYNKAYGKNDTKYAANDENLAAFYAVEYITDGDPAVKNVTLRRPFAQLNLGTTNAKATADPTNPTYTIALYQSKVKVENVPTVFNVATSDVSENATMYFELGDVPAEPLYVDSTPYEYAGMNYLFGGNNVIVTYDIKTKLTKQDGAEEYATVNNIVSNVPLKENYRTNIIGNLLTSTTEYDIVVDAEFDTNANTGTIEVITDGLVKNQNGDYEISTDKGMIYAINNLWVDENGVANPATFYVYPREYNITDDQIKDINVTSGTLKVIKDIPVMTRSIEFDGIVIKGLSKPLIATVGEEATVVISGVTIQNYEGDDESGALIGENDGKVIIEDCAIVDENGDDDETTELVGDNNDITGTFIDPSYEIEGNSAVVYDAVQLAAAFAADEVENIVLGANIAVEDVLVFPADREATLDLKGYELTIAGDEDKVSATYVINNHGTLTIKDSYGIGEVNARGIYNGYGNGGENVPTATLTIEGGTFNAKGTNGGAAVYNYGQVEIKGGQFTSIGGYSLNNQSGASMTIAEDVKVNNGIYNSGANLVINGGEIEGNRSGCHVVYSWNSTVTINGGTIHNNNSGNSTLMAAGTSKMTVNGGTFSIKDGRVEGNGNTWTSCLTDTQNSAELTVTGGTFNGGFRVQSGTKMTISGGSFNDCTGSNYNIYGNVEITGGIYTDDTAKKFAAKYAHKDYKLVGENIVPKVYTVEAGSEKYESIQEAVDNVATGETITLLVNINQEDGVLIEDKNLTVDLNGKTFTVSEGASTNNRNFKVTGTSVVTIKNGTMVAAGEITSGAYGTVRTEDSAKVTLNNVESYSYRGFGLNIKANPGTIITINDSKIYAQYSGGVEAAGGEIVLNNVEIAQQGVYSDAAWCSVAIGVNGGGKVTVNSGEYSAAAIATDSNAAQGTWVAYVMSSGGTLEIKGGTFNGTVAQTAAAANACGIICADTKAVVDIYEGTFNSNGAILDMRNNTGGSPNPVATLHGGTFSADPTVSGLYGSNLISVVEGFEVYQEGQSWKLREKGIRSWTEFTQALAAGETELKLQADITYDENYQLQKAVTIDLNEYSMTLPMINIHTKTTVKNGTINGKVYARKNAEIVFDHVTFSGAVADNLSTEGHLAIQGGCKSLYAKDCLFSPTSVSGSQTKPLSFEGGSTQMKFENCEFKSSPYKKQVYFNSLSATATLDFTNCNFNNKTPNIMFAAACPLTNVTMSGTTKLSSVTFEINRAKDAVTDADLAYLRTLIANNSISSVRLFYAGGSSEYIR